MRADPLDFGAITIGDLTLQTYYNLSNENTPLFIFAHQLSNKIQYNPMNLNLYLYPNNNPLLYIDPFGLSGKSNVKKWVERLKKCDECGDAINNSSGDEWDAFERCKKCCEGLEPRPVKYFSVTPCQQACVQIWKEKHGK